MKQVVEIPLRRISLSTSRPTVPETVNALASSLGELGLIQPITVRQGPAMDAGVAIDGYRVIAGNHRVAAARALGWDVIEAFVMPSDDRWDQEMREIDENLIRAELTAAQRAHAIKRRKVLWEQRHPPEEESGRNSPTLGGRGNKSFAAETESATGESKRRVNEHVSRADALGDDLEAITGTSLDKGVELDALKGMEPEERKPLIERAKAGEQVSARKPKPAKKSSTTFAGMILEKLEIIQRHLDSRDMDLDDFERQFLDELAGADDAFVERANDSVALALRIGAIAMKMEE